MVAIKLDMEKEYNRLEWNYILETFSQFCFNKKWIGWINECITTSSFSILVNNVPSDQFYPTRGIRQGDPLSPYIFIICAELLARQLQVAIDDPKSGIGIKITRQADKISFLTFADDTMIFAKANKKSCAIIKNVIREYCNMYGQLVNFHKSAYQCSKNVTRNTREDFRSILEMKPVVILDRYLGCPLINERVNNATFKNVVEWTTNTLTTWKANSLSKAGRVTLIQATLESTPLYSMQTFILPEEEPRRIRLFNQNFFRNNNANKKSQKPSRVG